MEIEMRHCFLTFLQIGPFFRVMVWRIDDEGDLVHVSTAGLNISSVLEPKDKFVCPATWDENHPRLIVRGAVVSRHQVASVRMKHCDHLIRRAFVEPSHQDRAVGDELEARVRRHFLPASSAVPSQEPASAFILSKAGLFAIFDFFSSANRLNEPSRSRATKNIFPSRIG
jgi:hypothetical protein